jgi:hypothetical protein
MTDSTSDSETVITDFGVAVFLSTQPSVTLLRAQAMTPSRVAFIFSPRSECDRLSALYASDQAKCSPRNILDRARAMKTLIHQIKSGSEPTSARS